MSRGRPRTTITTNVQAHPAVMAWLAVTGSGRVPESVGVVRDRPPPHTGIFWLPDVGERRTAVFAKRAPSAQILLERVVHEHFLARLPVSAPRYYGTCLDGPYGWLFLEDVGDVRYSRSDPEHLRLGAQWLGTLHIAAARIGVVDSLPDGGPSRYLGQLRATRAKVHAGLGRWTFPPAEVEVLATVLSWCDMIEAHWARVETGCAGVPATLVHGDFQPKNLFLMSNGDGLHLFPIDWEMAGWGPPPVDLTGIDLAAYWRLVREAWPELDFVTVERLARFGRLLEWIAAVDWECEYLRLEGAEHRSGAVMNLTVILPRLIAAAHAARVAE